MNRTALAIRHVAFEDLGIIEPLLIERGYTVRYLEAGVDAIDRATVTAADLLVVLGGPIGVYQTDRYPFLAEEKAAIAARLG
ncbi:glutamine amidotransferase, partial [Salmonella enterica]|nr:glutamine amidotransferase [Salmonella enterica]